MTIRKTLTVSLAVLATTPLLEASAEPTLELYVHGPGEVFQGDPISSSVDALGTISAGPEVGPLGAPFEHPVVSMARAPRGRVVVGTAGGDIFRYDPQGARNALARFEGQVISALASDRERLFVATAPDGVVWSVSEGGRRAPFIRPEVKYVWAMLPTPGGVLLATGAPGKVLEVSAQGSVKVRFDPGETHIRAMVRVPGRGLVVGGGQRGVVYQVEKGRTFALYDSELEEVTAFAVDPKTKDLYASLVSASSKGALEPATWVGAVKGEAEDEASPIKSSEVVRIRASGHVEKVWTSKREGALALHFDTVKRRLVIATGASPKNRARLYSVQVDARDRVSLDARVDAALATALVPAQSGGLLVGTAPQGQLLRVGPTSRAASSYVSVEQDLERISDIGRLWFDADTPPGSGVELRIRTGNTKKADETWSDWSAPVTLGTGGPVDVPAARYAQFEARLKASARGGAPRLKSMHASVQRINLPPKVEEVFMLRRGVYMAALAPEGEKERTVTLSKSVVRELRRRAAPARKRLRVRQGSTKGMMSVAWTASDENNDDLLYRVRIRRLDGAAAKDGWRRVADDQVEHFVSFDTRAYDDGRYQFEVTASDRPSNPPDRTLTDRLTSEPFDIDNTPPKLTKLTAVKVGDRVRISARARDVRSPLARAEVSIDGGPWLMLPASDGLIDARTEDLDLILDASDAPGAPKLTPGRHTVSVRVVDRGDNEVSASTRFRY